MSNHNNKSNKNNQNNQNKNDDLLEAFESLKIPTTHCSVGLSNSISSNKQIKSIFINKRLPDIGWSTIQIQSFLFLLSTCDTNIKFGDNSLRWCGVGEREGRVYSNLVAQRHFGLSHGMGRSGDITEPQPKAVGSSVLVQLTTILVLDAIRRAAGLNHIKAPKQQNNQNNNNLNNNNINSNNKSGGGPAQHGLVLPMCTGMSMSLVLSSLQTITTTTSSGGRKDIVLWSRIDQKSCYKAILGAGYQCIVIETKLQGDQVVTDLNAMKDALIKWNDSVLAVITTTSCFAPRVPDQVDEVAKLCHEYNVSHVINHAYGLQCQQTNKLMNRACVIGRVDAIVCSTDKNFMVPVGGAIVLSPRQDVIANVGKVYSGRASSSPIVDLFITLLSMGLNGYKKLLQDRMNLLDHFKMRLSQVATKYGERLLNCPANTISFGITLDHLLQVNHQQNQQKGEKEGKEEGEVSEEQNPKNPKKNEDRSREISYFGAMLFNRCISGTRVIPRKQVKTMSGQEFVGYGSSHAEYPHAYMTAACAIGVGREEVDEFFVRLDKTFQEFKKRQRKKQKQQQ